MLGRKTLFALFVVSHLVVAACSDSSNDEASPAAGQASSNTSTSSAASAVVQPRFLKEPSVVPPGFTKQNDVSVLDGSGVVVQTTVDYGAPSGNGAGLVVRQEYLLGGVPATAKHRAKRTTIHGREAYLATNDARNKHSYTWAVGDVLITVTGTGVERADVQAVAESMR